jgi:hypothetical protein
MKSLNQPVVPPLRVEHEGKVLVVGYIPDVYSQAHLRSPNPVPAYYVVEEEAQDKEPYMTMASGFNRQPLDTESLAWRIEQVAVLLERFTRWRTPPLKKLDWYLVGCFEASERLRLSMHMYVGFVSEDHRMIVPGSVERHYSFMFMNADTLEEYAAIAHQGKAYFDMDTVLVYDGKEGKPPILKLTRATITLEDGSTQQGYFVAGDWVVREEY